MASSFRRFIGCSLGAAALAIAATATPAAADPNPVTDYRILAGAGSDTTQDVTNHLGAVIGGANKVIASWDARGSATIKTKSAGCTFNRPNGSGAGRQALRASEGESGGVFQGANVLGCVDFARSSAYGGTSPSTTGNYTYITMGVDAMTYTINQNSDLPETMTNVQLQRIFKCLTNNINGTPVKPLLIQSGSGSRSFWLTKMSMTETEIANGDYPCLESLNNTIQEHDGRVLAGHNDYVLPFSVGQFIAQGNNGTTVGGVTIDLEDRRGPALLGNVAVSGVVHPPRIGGNLNINFPFNRDVYNVVPTADLGNAAIASTFVGPNSTVCTNDEVTRAYGFGFRASTGSQPADLLKQGCGDTYLKANG